MYRFIILLSIACTWASPAQNIRSLKKPVPIKDIKSRIINGEDAVHGQFPWQVALFVSTAEGTYFCGGSIISSNWVLTAAHCVDSANSFTLIVGTITPDLEGPETQFQNTNIYIRHENYSSDDSERIVNDIGMIRVRTPWRYNEFVRDIGPPPTLDEASAGDLVVVSGWGKTSDESSSISPVLKYVQLEIISTQECNRTFPLGDGVICANSATSSEHRSGCNGDSGGALVSEDRTFIIGVVSFGADAGCDLGFPSAFSSVAYFLDWILSNIGE